MTHRSTGCVPAALSRLREMFSMDLRSLALWRVALGITILLGTHAVLRVFSGGPDQTRLF